MRSNRHIVTLILHGWMTTSVHPAVRQQLLRHEQKNQPRLNPSGGWRVNTSGSDLEIQLKVRARVFAYERKQLTIDNETLILNLSRPPGTY